MRANVFVGREQELERLHQFLFCNGRGGHGQICLTQAAAQFEKSGLAAQLADVSALLAAVTALRASDRKE